MLKNVKKIDFEFANIMTKSWSFILFSISSNLEHSKLRKHSSKTLYTHKLNVYTLT